MADHCADPSNSKFLRQDLKLIFKNNQEWVALKKANDPAFFEKLNSGQQPDYL
jgi:carbonic anhydrase